MRCMAKSKNAKSITNHARCTFHSQTNVVLIDYPRYFDPITKTTCPIEVALHRLEDNRLPPPGPFNRLLAKLQGVFASATPFCR